LEPISPISSIHDDPIDAWDPWAVLVIAMAASKAWACLRHKNEAAAPAPSAKPTSPRLPQGGYVNGVPAADRGGRARSRSAA
jgi:hypothetical protein